MHENRETSEAPRPERERGRSAKAQSHTPDAHAPEESDRAILSPEFLVTEIRLTAEPKRLKEVNAMDSIRDCLYPHRLRRGARKVATRLAN